MFGFNIVDIEDSIMALDTLTEEDRRVLGIVCSFGGCGEAYIKANLAGEIAKFAGCEAWKIAMNYTYALKGGLAK